MRAVAAVVDSRAAIEQAKGVLMLVYGLTAERAFDVLVWRSQETNIKVRELAQRLLAELSAVDIPGPARETVDYLLLTLDERVT
ncbi:ANTAR domain-containing protein [Mycobacterium intracellulare]|uniref:ANTAR domain-containing protein n=1 Tax=Mycobacterium intracellulare TaxID=1767 RepID=UPI0031ECD631